MNDITGLIAGILTTIAFLPQAMQIYKTKHTKDLSLSMFLIFSLGVLTWAIYGFMLGAYPVIIANGLTLIICFYIIIMKIKYK